MNLQLDDGAEVLVGSPAMETRVCSVELCERTVRAKGLCPGHYDRLRKYGDPFYEPTPSPRSEETKAKISATLKGRRIWEEAGRTHPSLGRVMSEETRERIGAALRGRPGKSGPDHPMHGKRHSPETRQRISEATLGKKRGPQPNKYAENPGYMAVHNWMRRHHPKTGMCEACQAERITYWSNISGEYLREREDFWELCVPCHKLFDFILAIEKADPTLIAVLRGRRLKE